MAFFTGLTNYSTLHHASCPQPQDACRYFTKILLPWPTLLSSTPLRCYILRWDVVPLCSSPSRDVIPSSIHCGMFHCSWGRHCQLKMPPNLGCCSNLGCLPNGDVTSPWKAMGGRPTLVGILMFHHLVPKPLQHQASKPLHQQVSKPLHPPGI